jgi:hypothetical protein
MFLFAEVTIYIENHKESKTTTRIPRTNRSLKKRLQEQNCYKLTRNNWKPKLKHGLGETEIFGGKANKQNLYSKTYKILI